MKYIISRTSSYEDESPHPRAEKVTLEHYKDIRTFSSKEEWLRRIPNDKERALKWGITSKGQPFMIRDGSHISFWIIEIEDLLSFVKEVGDNIILSSPCEAYIGYENIFQIEIYDDYRE